MADLRLKIISEIEKARWLMAIEPERKQTI